MKKICIFALCVVVTVFLFGCQAAEDPIMNADTTKPHITPLSPTEPTQTVVFENLYAIALPISYQSFSKENELIFEYSYPTMFLTIPDSEVADKIIVDFLNRIDGTHSDAQNTYNRAIADHASVAQWTPYTYHISYDPMRIDQGVLSLFGQTIQYSGGSHSNRTCVSANYDMITGNLMTLGSILYHLDAKDDLCNLVIQQLREQKESLQLYSDFDEVVEDHFSADESHFESFFFSSTGLNFYFAPYEIAPYASGNITVEIPYAQLTGIIGDQYFPAERQASSGDITAHLFSDADLDKYEQFAEIIKDEGGEKIILATDEVIYDVRIYSGMWNMDGNEFTITNTLFAANVLTSQDAVMLEAYIPDVMPDLMISYNNGNSTNAYYIHQSGEDGSIILEQTTVN